ncbi:DUF4167 domain-containing protein [Candidatus Finniella inopinata]|uniref:DUF4167 domain-containing protein n=2 Tax=Candidatus Finniella inopinata TaxID=1696036 RepID=A0A4Q7DPM6_9PROT|nr:DUF4167 domain-containing protein [Candidatus Finniella inopinata]
MSNNEQTSNFEPSRHENSKPRPQNNGPRNYQHLFDKYMNLAREALSCGDRVAAEYNYQHADHYLRVLNERQSQRPAPQQPDRDANRQENADVETAPESKIESGVEQEPQS